MRIKSFISLGGMMMAITVLSGCGGTQTTYLNVTPNSPYGTITNYSFTKEEAAPGKWLTFNVNPAEDFLINTVKVNGEDAILQNNVTNTYMYQLKEGVNKIEATYKVNPTIDFVDKFDINISDELFDRVMNQPKTLDFRADGIEHMDAGGFLNCVDGDRIFLNTFCGYYGCCSIVKVQEILPNFAFNCVAHLLYMRNINIFNLILNFKISLSKF